MNDTTPTRREETTMAGTTETSEKVTCKRCGKVGDTERVGYDGQHWKCYQKSQAIEDAGIEVENAMEDVAGLLEQLKEARKALRKAENKRERLIAMFGENH